MRCDVASHIVTDSDLDGFQSLLGFLMRCDARPLECWGCRSEVSIPAGFSDALRLCAPEVFPVSVIGFQSLLGFLMRCDQTVYEKWETERTVSIPAGFSDALRRFMRMRLGQTSLFQSLLGFLMRCDSGQVRISVTSIDRFNPCWVF